MYRISRHVTSRVIKKGNSVFYIAFALLMPSIILLIGLDAMMQASRVIAEPIQTNQMVMPFDAKVHITINNAVTNSCDGNFGISAPENRELVQNYNSQRGTTVVVGPYDEGDELIFYIEPHSFCSGYQYESTNPNHARVHEIAEGIWRIEWEDLPDNWPPDNDFDDLIITIRLAGAYPDFKQNVGDWADDLYDHNNPPGNDIAEWGCALTSVANLLAFYGARDVDPGELNTYLINHNGGYTIKGGVDWTATDNYTPSGSGVTVMDYSRRRYRGYLNLTEEISQSIENNWPVVFEYEMPSSPSGVHFLVAVSITETTPGNSVYIMKDPSSSTASIEQVPLDDARIISAIFFEPSDQIPRPDMVIYGHSPIELLIIDSSGRRLGYDNISGESFWEIPDGYYGYEGPYWNPIDESRTGEVGGAQIVEVPGLAQGSYRLLVNGTGEGDFTLETFYDHGTGDIHTSQITGEVQMGTTIAYDLQVGSTWLAVTPNTRIDLIPEEQPVHVGDDTTVTVILTDGAGNTVPGETILLSTTLGAITPTTVTDAEGMATATFSAGKMPGTASITAQTSDISTKLDIEVVQNNHYLPITVNQVP